MNPTIRWAVVSLTALTAVELGCLATGNLYTDHYRAARRSRGGLLPLVAAGVVFAHLEGWIPQKADPFSAAGRVVARVRHG